MDLDSVLQRIGNYRGVTGYIILNQEGNVITSTLSDEEVRPLATLVYRQITQFINSTDNLLKGDSVEFIQLRTAKREILIKPSVDYTFAVFRDPLSSRSSVY